VNLATRLRLLKVSLVLFGLIFLVGVYPMMMAWWPSGWRWNPNQPEYEQMILGVYATLGVFLLIASRNPLKHRSLIWFTVWSSLVHGSIMAVQAINMPSEHGYLLGDVPALALVAVVLAALMPLATDAETAGTAT
jgi:hydrogenase/urease accessory protein HupE